MKVKIYNWSTLIRKNRIKKYISSYNWNKQKTRQTKTSIVRFVGIKSEMNDYMGRVQKSKISVSLAHNIKTHQQDNKKEKES